MDGEKWWHDGDRLRAEYEEHGTWAKVRNAHPEAPSARYLRECWANAGLPRQRPGPKKEFVPATDKSTDDEKKVLDALHKLGDEATIEAICDEADMPPGRVRAALELAGHDGYRIVTGDTTARLERVDPAPSAKLHPSLFDGEHQRVGLVSDTHLGANEEALEELHLAYDVFAEQGITQVWHAGDWGTGCEIFRGHHSEAKVHTLDEQVRYLIDNYPRRDGITTRGISGNHDMQGLAGRAGFDPIVPFSNERPDIEYLGIYDAWFETRPGTGKWIHLLHGAGGMSYSWSYKAQKLADSYPSARKPAVLCVGHWHVKGNVRHRDVEIVWPGCFEWQSPFMKRLGLQPAVGFHILDFTVADDGSVVRFRPEWWPYFPGRVVA